MCAVPEICFIGTLPEARGRGRWAIVLSEPFRALAHRPRPRGPLVCAASRQTRPFYRLSENVDKEQETGEQRAEWFTEHDALPSPAP